MVGASQHEAQLVGLDTNSLENGSDDELVKVRAVLYHLNGSLEVVEEGVDIGEEDRDIAVGGEELGNLDGGDEVTGVRLAGSGSS